MRRNAVTHSDECAIPLPNCTLEQREGIWTLFYKGQEYIRLLEAKSRTDAQEQIAEMLITSMEARLNRPSFSFDNEDD